MKVRAKLLSMVFVAGVLVLSACGGGGGGNGGVTTYSVTYDGNGSTAGSVPVDGTAYKAGDTVSVADNTGSLSRAHFTFVGWNTLADGSGTSYTHGQTFTLGSADVILYARWTANPTFSVTYDPNSADAGTAPIDSATYEAGASLVLSLNTGTLARSGYVFTGWNLSSDGTGSSYVQGETFTMGGGNVTFYAKWNALAARRWLTVDSSSDGKYIIAGTFGDRLYLSKDYGATWTDHVSSRNWASVAISDDGMQIAGALIGSPWEVYASTDGGVTWESKIQLASDVWALDIAGNGSVLAAAGGAITGDQIHISRNMGSAWNTYGPTEPWGSFAINSDGTKLAAASNLGGTIYTSIDSGATWTARPVGINGCFSLAQSDDGQRLAAANYVYSEQGIAVSSDGGATWNYFNPPGTGTHLWENVSQSRDGRYLVAMSMDTDRLFVSSDFGQTWVPRGPQNNWNWSAVSAEGRRMTAVADGGYIYTSADYGVTWTPRF